MAAKNSKTKKRGNPRKRRKGFLPALLALAALAGGLWVFATPPAEPENPDVLVNLKSMVGKPAPPFTLADSEGKRRTVAPGGGRPFLIIFHMGSV